VGDDGRPLINGHAWDSPGALALVKRAAGNDAWLEAYAGPERFDVLPLLVATDGAVEAFGRDIRRLRPNILIGGVEGMDETRWPGADLHIGHAVMRLDSLRGRCPMTTVDPDTLERDPEVLRDIGRRFGGRLALNAEVVRGGDVRVGDTVTLARQRLHRSDPQRRSSICGLAQYLVLRSNPEALASRASTTEQERIRRDSAS
jgi:hypothetical protein